MSIAGPTSGLRDANLRCLFVINHAYLPERVGGAESTIHELCLGLRHAGLPCAVLCRRWQKNLEPRALAVLEFGASLARRAHISRDTDLGYPVYRYRRRRAPVRRVVRAFSPDIAVVHANPPIGVADDLLRAGVPVIVYVQDTEFERFEGDLKAAPGKHFLANSPFTAARLKQYYGIDACFVPPLVDPARYAVTSSRTKAVMVNPHPHKGVDITLQLARRRPDIPFELFEAWPMPEAMRAELTAKSQTLRNVAWRPHELDPREIYRHARILLVPSRWGEGWGRVVTEAQLNGIPVLASDRGNLADTVGAGGVTLDPDADISLWCDSLSGLWDREDVYERYAQAALEHARRPSIQPDVIIPDFIRFARSCLPAR